MREAVAALWHATHRIASGPEVGTAAITFASAEPEELDEPLEQGGFPAVDAKVPLRHDSASADFCQQLCRQVELRRLESGVIGVHRIPSFAWVAFARCTLRTRDPNGCVENHSFAMDPIMSRQVRIRYVTPRGDSAALLSRAADRECIDPERRLTDADRHARSI